MKLNYFFVFILALQIYTQQPLLSEEAAISVPQEFVRLMQTALTSKEITGTYSWKDLEYEGVAVYDGQSLFLQASVKKNSWLISMTDPRDLLAIEHDVPLMYFGFQEGSYFNDIGKSPYLSGKDIIKIATDIAQLIGINTFIIRDAAVSTQCPSDGLFCKEECLYCLRMLGAFTSGQSYYEKFGAVTPSFNPYYRPAVQFIQSIPVSQFIEEFAFLSKSYPYAMSRYLLLREIVKNLDATPSEITLGELGKRLWNASLQDQSQHQLWHQFHDVFIAQHQTFFMQFISDALTNESLNKEVLRCLAFILREDFKKIYQDSKDLNRDKDFDRMNFQEIQEIYLQALFGNLYNNNSPSAFTLIHQASSNSLKKYLRHYHLWYELHPQADEILQQAEAAYSLYSNGSNEEEFDIEKTMSQLLQWNKVRNKGELFALWMLAKRLVFKHDVFVFDFVKNKAHKKSA
ncbi:MAG: hypothetical protein Tsb0021_01140 [Chlamydiales bacterium]